MEPIGDKFVPGYGIVVQHTMGGAHYALVHRCGEQVRIVTAPEGLAGFEMTLVCEKCDTTRTVHVAGML